MSYINREDAISALKSDPMGGLNYERILGELPTAEVSPVVHGRWLRQYGKPVCSVCGNSMPFEDQYCSNCGARMDGEIPEDDPDQAKWDHIVEWGLVISVCTR